MTQDPITDAQNDINNQVQNPAADGYVSKADFDAMKAHLESQVSNLEVQFRGVQSTYDRNQKTEMQRRQLEEVSRREAAMVTAVESATDDTSRLLAEDRLAQIRSEKAGYEREIVNADAPQPQQNVSQAQISPEVATYLENSGVQVTDPGIDLALADLRNGNQQGFFQRVAKVVSDKAIAAYVAQQSNSVPPPVGGAPGGATGYRDADEVYDAYISGRISNGEYHTLLQQMNNRG